MTYDMMTRQAHRVPLPGVWVHVEELHPARLVAGAEHSPRPAQPLTAVCSQLVCKGSGLLPNIAKHRLQV